MRFRRLLLLSLFSLVVTTAAAQRPWQSEDTFRIRYPGSLALSPDGQWLLFTLSGTRLEANQNYSSVWVIPAAGGDPKALTQRHGVAFSPRWSPDGRRIAYFSYESGGLTLQVMNRDGSGRRRLARLERSNAYLGWGDNVGNGLSWSPDGSRLAYTAAGPRYYSNDPSPRNPPNGNEPMVVDRILFKSTYYFSDLRRTQVWTVSSRGGDPRLLAGGDFDYHSIDWSRDGESLVGVSNRTGRDDFDSNTDLVLISTRDGAVRPLTRTAGPEYQPRWSADGWLAYQGRVRAGRSRESDPELKKIYVLDPNGGDPLHLTAPLDRWSNPPRWQGGRVWFTAQNRGTVTLYSVSRQGGAVRTEFEGRGRVGSFDAGRGVYLVYSDDRTAPEIYRLEEDRSLGPLTSFNRELMDQVRIRPSEYFTYSSFDGLEIDGWLIRPSRCEAGRRCPLVLGVHGGPHGQYGYFLSGKHQYLAAQGYAVLLLNPRGSTGRGQEFSDLCVGDLGGGDYRDLMAGVDHALERFPFLDPERMGVTGVSYGGYMTNWIITHTDRFKAAVPVSSISNLISMWGTVANFLWFPADMGFKPMDNYERAWEVSPLKYVKNCRTPTLFISGAWDFITPVYQAEEMFIALKMLGVETVHASYPNEGHGVRNQPAHTHDYHRRTVQWFDRFLK